MAKIDLYPISIDGVKPPLNLLDRIFGQSPQDTNLFYPIDLGSNPRYNHAVQFTAYDYVYPGIETLKNTIRGISTSGEYGTIVENLPSIINPQNLKPTKGSPLSTISLYMPDTLETRHNHDYTDLSITDTLGAVSYVGAGVSEYAAQKGRSPEGSQGGVVNAFVNAAIQSRFGEGGRTLYGNIVKQVTNPQIQLIYKGTSLREFTLEFLFNPKSVQEAESVDKIIKQFVYYSSPDVLLQESGQFLIPPQIWTIKFSFLGGRELFDSAINFFKSLGTNILGGNWWQTASDQKSNISNAPNARIFQIGDCFLQDVDVNYAPSGQWASYEDGFPLQISLRLHFRELEIVTKKRLNGELASLIGNPLDTWRNIQTPNGQ